jgi:tetraacyldisaccharide 4'-kinase
MSMVYRAAIGARSVLYRTGVISTHELSAPVISVGNLTTGGTGKTPLVEWLARACAGDGHRVCILTRGYGRSRPRDRVVVSDGEELLADAEKGGDEPRLLAERLRGIAAVISDADRVAGGLWARKNLRSNLFIVDDGFQHRRLGRDLDIVAIDASNPWGGGSLLPAGRLREPRKEIARADCIVVTRADLAPSLSELLNELEKLSGGSAILVSRMLLTGAKAVLVDLHGNVSLEGLDNPIAAFCGIGNPEAFFQQLRTSVRDLSFTHAFPDHHVYSQHDISRLTATAQSRGARTLVTTAKDAVKLRELSFDLPCYSCEIEIKFEDEKKLMDIIRGAVASARPKPQRLSVD